MHSLKVALLALGAASVVACSEGAFSNATLLGPSSLGSPSGTGTTFSINGGPTSRAGFAFSTLGQSRVPPISVPDGISCPNDAPIVMIGERERRIDIEWSPIPRVQGYQVSIEAAGVGSSWQVVKTIETTDVSTEWTGLQGTLYRARVRSRVCNSFGIWSNYAVKGLDAPPPPPIAPPPPPQTCEEPTVKAGRGFFSVQGAHCDDDDEDEEDDYDY